jgi:hypothetical protein
LIDTVATAIGTLVCRDAAFMAADRDHTGKLAQAGTSAPVRY